MAATSLPLLANARDELLHFVVAAELVGHEAAGNHDAVEVVGFHQLDRGIGAARVAVLAAVDFIPHRAGDDDVSARLGEPQLGIPDFQIFVVVADEHQETEVGQRSFARHGWSPFWETFGMHEQSYATARCLAKAFQCVARGSQRGGAVALGRQRATLGTYVWRIEQSFECCRDCRAAKFADGNLFADAQSLQSP